MALQQRAAHLQRKSRSRFRFAKHHFHPSQWTWRPWKSRTASKHVSAGRWELLPAANPGVNRFTVPPEEMEAEWTGHEWNVMDVVQTAEQRKLHDTLLKDTSAPKEAERTGGGEGQGLLNGRRRVVGHAGGDQPSQSAGGAAGAAGAYRHSGESSGSMWPPASTPSSMRGWPQVRPWLPSFRRGWTARRSGFIWIPSTSRRASSRT